MHLLLATSWLDPIVNGLSWLVLTIDKPIGNLGVSLIVLAALIRALFWPLNTAQFKSMMAMQKVAPQIKKLQERFKSEPQRLQQETMALYKANNVNPLAGCLPLLAQMPVLFSVYYVVVLHKNLYETTNFLWIGSALASHAPKLFGIGMLASSLAQPDILLIVIYMVSQYISMRFTTMPATDPAQAQQMKMMQIVSPLMIGFFGFRAQWPSAMVLYWLAQNVLQMGQQLYLLRRYHEPLSFIDSDHVITADLPDAGGGAVAALAAKPGPNKPRTRKKKNKK
ncbi:MAG TPA: YidC/Oxa1 family membrane protein insertase [Verrucomicrobiae bacterium]|nr:YidC/Oxa1 family membrane protein insertase [Verrucomicrobiae bacterium]